MDYGGTVMNDIHQQQLKQVRESVYEENLRLRAELAAANEFKKHYTDLISVNAELMGAPNDGSITDSVVQIEKLVKKLRADLDAANEEVEKLRERLGPHGLVVVDIDKTGHYVSEKVADEITRLRTDLAVANERCEMLTKEVVEWRSRPDALRADKAEADLDAAISERNGHYATLKHVAKERDEALRNQAETQSKLDALEKLFQMTCQQFEEKRQRILEVLD